MRELVPRVGGDRHCNSIPLVALTRMRPVRWLRSLGLGLVGGGGLAHSPEGRWRRPRFVGSAIPRRNLGVLTAALSADLILKVFGSSNWAHPGAVSPMGCLLALRRGAPWVAVGLTYGCGALRNYSGPERVEPFDPSRVGEMVRDAIRGRRAQEPRPCPRLLNFNPFGVGQLAGTADPFPQVCSTSRRAQPRQVSGLRWMASAYLPSLKQKSPRVAAASFAGMTSARNACVSPMTPVPKSGPGRGRAPFML
jgi:hypothetical protein